MTGFTFRRGLYWLVAVLLVLLLAVVGGSFLAAKALKAKVVEALGPQGEVGEIRLSLSAVEILNVRIKAASGWPAADELNAKRVVIEPELASLVSRQIRIAQIRIEDGYLSLQRPRSGKLQILPSLLAKETAEKRPDSQEKEGAAGQQVHIGGIVLSNCALDFFDASIRQPALKIRLDQVNAKIGKVSIPELNGRTEIELEGRIKGVQRDGHLAVKGGADLSSRDSDIVVQLRGVDLLALQPYLIKATETSVKKGTLDLDLKSSVVNKRMKAPGSLTLTGLELGSGSSFMGVPRAAVVGLLKDKNNRISLQFVLEGNLDDPHFSLNEGLATRVGTSFASAIGVSVEGLVKGVGSVGGGTAKGIGGAVGKLFGK